MREHRAFTLLELLVVIGLVALLLALLVPALRAVRESARTIRCSSNIRQLVTAWSLYAGDFEDLAMPLAYTDLEDTGGGDRVYWFGAEDSSASRVMFDRGFVAPYLDTSLAERSVLECPSQPWGTYRAQGQFREVTSTYGYNGYYLCPPKTPGWSYAIGGQRWKRLADLDRPESLFVFADTLLAGSTPRSTALLDPPMLFNGPGNWTPNPSPTTVFRHAPGQTRGTTVSARADGSVRAVHSEQSWLSSAEQRIGSVGRTNDPHYVPDWRSWR